MLPPGHPLAAAPRITLADLAEEDWVSGAPGVPNRVCLDSLGPVHVAYETRDYEVTIALVEAGLGVSLVPASLLAGQRAVVVRDLHGQAPAREVHVVHPPRPAAPVVELLGRFAALRAGPQLRQEA